MNSLWRWSWSFFHPSSLWGAADLRNDGVGLHILDAQRRKSSPPHPKGSEVSPYPKPGRALLGPGLSMLIPIFQSQVLPLPTLYSKHPDCSHCSTSVNSFHHSAPGLPSPLRCRCSLHQSSRPHPSKCCPRAHSALFSPLPGFRVTSQGRSWEPKARGLWCVFPSPGGPWGQQVLIHPMCVE